MPNFWWTGAPFILKIQWFPLSILIFGQKSCFLGPTTTELILIHIHYLGLTLWNLNSFEFKFDDTRLGPIKRCCVLTQQKKILIGPILFLYFEESLVSSNLNSKLLWFHSVRPNLHLCLNLDTEGNKACKEAVTSSVHSFFFVEKRALRKVTYLIPLYVFLQGAIFLLRVVLRPH